MGYKVFVDFEMVPVSREYKEIKSRCRQEIIQIGAVILDDNNEEIAEFKRNIAPRYVKEVPRKLIRLLGLSYDEIFTGCDFNIGIREFFDWIYSYSSNANIYAWSNSDFAQLVYEIRLKDTDVSETDLKQLGAWYDLQKIFDGIIKAKDNTGLKSAIEMCGIEFEGKEHDSLIDAKNTAKVYLETENPDELVRMIEMTKKYTENSHACSVTLGDLFDFAKLGQAVI